LTWKTKESFHDNLARLDQPQLLDPLIPDSGTDGMDGNDENGRNLKICNCNDDLNLVWLMNTPYYALLGFSKGLVF